MMVKVSLQSVVSAFFSVWKDMEIISDWDGVEEAGSEGEESKIAFLYHDRDSMEGTLGKTQKNCFSFWY